MKTVTGEEYVEVEDEYIDLCHEFDTDDPCGCHVDYQWMIACQNRCDKCATCFACSGETKR